MNGRQWQEAMSRRTIPQLTRLNNALVVLSEDPDIEREFGDTGLFSGFPCLLSIINETVRVKNKEITHRKLTESERDRMIDMHASGPLDYKPKIDDELMKLGLVRFWNDMKDAVENTELQFYTENGRIMPEWYDFKTETNKEMEVKDHI